MCLVALLRSRLNIHGDTLLTFLERIQNNLELILMKHLDVFSELKDPTRKKSQSSLTVSLHENTDFFFFTAFCEALPQTSTPDPLIIRLFPRSLSEEPDVHLLPNVTPHHMTQTISPVIGPLSIFLYLLFQNCHTSTIHFISFDLFLISFLVIL